MQSDLHSDIEKDHLEPEDVFERTAAVFAAHRLPEHYRRLCEFSAQHRQRIETLIRGRHPALSATAVDNAAHAVLKRIWKLAPGLALGCPEAAQFDGLLTKVLKPCIHFCALDEARKFQRQQRLLEAHAAEQAQRDGITEAGTQCDGSQPEEEFARLILALRCKIAETSTGGVTAGVLEILCEEAGRCNPSGGTSRHGRGNDWVRQELRKRRIWASAADVTRARARIARMARRLG
jgi:hypothetical protein